MFGSRKDDEKKAKRSFWPWGRRTQNEVSEEQVEPKAEPAVEDVVSTVETPEVTPESASESSAGVIDVVPEVAEHPEDKPVHHEPLGESAHKVPGTFDEEVPVLAVTTETPQAAEPELQPENTPVSLESKPEVKGGFFARMRQGLSKTRNVLVEGVAELFIGKKEIDDDLLDELETQLLVADVGVEATTEIIEKLTQKVKYKELDDADALMVALQSELAEILEPADQPLVIPKQDTPFVILVVGVNGVGKTTTIGKLARKLQSEGRKVMLAAGDTFRAAAVEQLQVWGERNEIPVIAQHTGADSASVIFDAFEAARARNVDVLIADTAGRLHNKDHLMEELKKVKRVLGKLDPSAPHEVLLVLDAGTGQNALSQARLFHETVQLTGMALTKLDGTAKGGVIFALSKQMKLPIRFLGVGEQIDDLRPFSANEFVKALFSREG
ncbi:signal recognition particle-docking protein FtsY [Endozoicomonas elysicola]|uniref:Signal recognition particle receptor FtsY n=1 Tax=Endozoicomonas elysicola TaxID=305900 RepID=A0A081K7V2_9GAMM|nr:signal recognition particle-docking protein FtsY [Endozoicomonas elysicola]KEI70228.1 cell division protein FtsY [Endozoicomonas elysicola]